MWRAWWDIYLYNQDSRAPDRSSGPKTTLLNFFSGNRRVDLGIPCYFVYILVRADESRKRGKVESPMDGNRLELGNIS